MWAEYCEAQGVDDARRPVIIERVCDSLAVWLTERFNERTSEIKHGRAAAG
jgi:hypothetical protein